ncbi:glycoside hydrolase family 127 protein [Sediminibacterium roseum]|uniref:Glycoside hydrolase family 127 protein n=1 Tax=Sediminibacterium roseum TaxID=1978412 RepID=A0ABW9ZYN7_9BACT|nr:beta-L-arabinofuranosidase domain-containing protein [Sediminibacterium roseum]NCI50847.1 glycoside hydrolase family 127 protein [Sediminibacterium roseum]
MKNCLFLLLGVSCVFSVQAQHSLQHYQNVNFSKVQITDDFWKPKIAKVSTVTIPVCIDQTEVKTPRIQNFEIAAGKKQGKFKGIFYDDSDVFKALEAMSYSLKNHPDAAMEKKADDWIDLIAAAQQPDGYINTYYSLQFPEKRWTDMSMHEDYNGGHLIEAAVAYYDATGKRKLLDVAIKFANHFNSLFGPGKRDWVTGHQELELALVKLYKVTKEEKYLRLADWLLSERGHQKAVGYTWTDWKDTAYAQDIKPVKEQKEITGHAVRAMYMYTGAADVAALTGDEGYMHAMKDVWEDVVYRNMYITGGIGSSGGNEGFSVDYDLPNENAYCETCASVGMVLWNQRMGMLTGESKYVDVLEKSLYNGALDGISLAGDKFFYGNTLASMGKQARRDWFGTACCPANIARLIESLGNYIYGSDEKNIWVNLFVGSNTNIAVGGKEVPLAMKTNYPWDGRIEIAIDPKQKTKFGLRIRMPGWVNGEAVPGGLYNFENTAKNNVTVLLNGKAVNYTIDKGYAVIDREWSNGDKVTVDFPMEIKRVYSRSEVKSNIERVAIQRGPMIYCVEGMDNAGKAVNIVLPKTAALTTAKQTVLSEPVVTIQGDATVLTISTNGDDVRSEKKKITAIPYYTWNNRGAGQMLVWLPERIVDVKVN